MAKAETGVELDIAWTFTLKAIDQDDGWSGPFGTCPTDRIQGGIVFDGGGAHGTLWCSGDGVGFVYYGDPKAESGDTHYGLYHSWRISATAPYTDEDAQEYAVWMADTVKQPPVWPAIPGDAEILMDPSEISADVTISFTNIVAKGEVTDETPGTREPLDFTDYEAAYAWFADGNSEITVEVAAPNSVTLSATGDHGLSGEIDLGDSLDLVYLLDVGVFVQQDTAYAQILAIEWNGDSVDLENLDLWWASDPPEENVPDAGEPNWSRDSTDKSAQEVHIYDVDGETGMAIAREGSGTTGRDWTGETKAPFLVTFHIRDGFFDRDEAAAINYVTPAITWSENGGSWSSAPEVFGHALIAKEQENSWEFEHEWKRFSTKDLYVYVDEDWRSSQGEDVGGSNVAENDRQCGMFLHRLAAPDWEGAPWWGTFLTVSHDATIDVNDPTSTRPSLWTGHSGVTVNPGDNDEWEVADSTTDPYVARDMATRFWLRMDRLGDLADDSTNTHVADWPIMLKANLGSAVTQDDSGWVTSVPDEDITNWAEFGYLQIGLSAPRAETVTLQVDYKVCSFDDPCYTTFAPRWGPGGQWSYTTTERTATYSFPVVSGSNTVLVDLCLPSQGNVPTDDYRIQHVETMTFALPDNSTGSTETWTLTEITLTLDPGEGSRSEPSAHMAMRSKRAWDWSPNEGDTWFGIGAVVDGKDALELDYGYTDGHTREEKKLLYNQKQRPYPSGNRGDHAKSLSRLEDEVNWQEGWVATYISANVEESANNKDGSSIRLKSDDFAWWDMRHCDEDSWQSGNETIDGAVCVGRWDIIAGVQTDVYVNKFPRGRVHGLAIADDWESRLRDTQSMTLLGRIGAGPWSTEDTATTDEHGRFRFDPVLEKGKTYRVKHGGSSLAVANREYTTDIVTVEDLYAPYMVQDTHGVGWRTAEDSNGVIYCHRWDAANRGAGWVGVTKPFGTATGYTRSSIAVYGDGSLYVAATDSSADTVITRSRDQGVTWSEVATANIGAGLENGTIAHRDGETFCVGWDDADDGVKLRASSRSDLDDEDLTTGVTTLTVVVVAVGSSDPAPISCVQPLTDGGLLVCVTDDGDMDTYRLENYTDGFTLVT